ncbi:MAG: hypothetical protein H0U81_02220 [Pyrinomonadaceae bacterium]|nr:hypothetical protein [Pyrinomonadaceae bacterium]
MSTNISRSPETEAIALVLGDLAPSCSDDTSPACANIPTLGSLPIGAHIILRCRKDWRDATVIAVTPDSVTLSIGAPSGRTYRVRRPPASPLTLDGEIPVLGEGLWRVGFARYDVRW